MLYSEKLNGPNLLLIRVLVKELHIPVIAEEKINTPEDLRDVLDVEAYSAVVGGAITRPQQIAKKIRQNIKK